MPKFYQQQTKQRGPYEAEQNSLIEITETNYGKETPNYHVLLQDYPKRDEKSILQFLRLLIVLWLDTMINEMVENQNVIRLPNQIGFLCIAEYITKNGEILYVPKYNNDANNAKRTERLKQAAKKADFFIYIGKAFVSRIKFLHEKHNYTWWNLKEIFVINKHQNVKL